MSRPLVARISILITAVLLISACGSGKSGKDKLAVVNWKDAVAGHPQEESLRRNEKIVEDLLRKRDAQALRAKSQLDSVLKLRALQQRSRQSYAEAEFNAKMAEAHAEEGKRLEKQFAALEREADALIHERRQALEQEYRLKIFNLRLQLEAVKMKQEERQAVEQILQSTQDDFGKKLELLAAEKQAYLKEKMQPYVLVMNERLGDKAEELGKKVRADLSAGDDEYSEKLGAAPQALQKALEIMDQEIGKQREKNEELRKKIEADIESAVMKLAQERGYTVVFNEYKVNVKADDLTDEVVKEIKNK